MYCLFVVRCVLFVVRCLVFVVCCLRLGFGRLGVRRLRFCFFDCYALCSVRC